MEHGTDKPEPSWLQSAYSRAYAAAEPGQSATWYGLAFAENNWTSLVDYAHCNAYESVTTPSNFTHANPWATSPPNNHVISPFINSNPLQLTENAFPAGFAADAANNDGTTLLPAVDPYAWGATAPTTHSNHNNFAPLVPWPLTGSTFAANATYNGDITYPTVPNAYTGVATAPVGSINNNAFASFINSNLSPLTGNTSAANATYNGGTTYPTAPSPYALGPTVASGLMDLYTGAGLQYPDPTLPIMDPFAADNNGNGYHGQFPIATSSNTQSGAAVEPHTAFHATPTSPTAPLVLAQQTPPLRPTCPTCNRSFSRHADLDRHAKKHRTDAKVFRCGCGYSSYRKDKLGEHVRRSGHGAAVAVGVALEGV